MAPADLTLAHYAAPALLVGGPRVATFQARAGQSGQLVVVHVVQPEFNPAPAAFLEALRTAAHLRHPGLVPILDFGHAAGRGFWVTPFYPAGSLRRRLEKAGPLAADVAAGWLAAAAEALAYLHRRGLVHGGLTARRLLLAADHTLMDGAGLAALWCRPGQAPPAPADDVRALGALLAEMITGQPPSEALGLVPEPWAGLVRSVTAPEEHHPEAAAFAAALRAALETRAPTSPSPANESEPEASPPTVDAAEPELADTGPLPPIAPPPAHPAALETPARIDVIQAGQPRRTFTLTSGALTLGRDPACEIVLDQPEVSRRHLRLSVEAGDAPADPAQVHVTDLGSVNGTYLDGQRLPPHMPQVWPPGVSITVGLNVLSRRHSAAAPEPTPARAPRPRRRYHVTTVPLPEADAPRVGPVRAQPARALTVLATVGLVLLGALAVAAAWPAMASQLAWQDQSAQAAETATAAWLIVDDDRDGLANGLELTYGSLPLVPDSDGDGLTDGNEVRRGLNPADPDSDRDRTPDPMDLAAGQTPTPWPSATPTLGAVSVTGLEPASAVAGAESFLLTVRGAGFGEGAVVRWGQAERPATVVDSQTLTTLIAAGDVADAGRVAVSVRVPGAPESAALEFVVGNPLPVLYAGGLDPATVTASGPPLTLVVNGAGFANGAVVRWNGSDRPTVYRGTGELLAFIDAADLARAGSASVSVFNPAPGGGLSDAQVVTIVAAAPALTGLSPSVAVAGGPALTLTLTGVHIQPGLVARWNGTDRPTTFVSDTQLTLNLSASDLAVAGSATLALLDPRTGALSNALRFSVVNAVPALTALAPANAPAGGPGLVLAITGAGFAPGAVAYWNGAPRPTTFLNSTQITAAIPAADLAAAGPVVISAANPGPGGGPSQTTLVFTVAAP